MNEYNGKPSLDECLARLTSPEMNGKDKWYCRIKSKFYKCINRAHDYFAERVENTERNVFFGCVPYVGDALDGLIRIPFWSALEKLTGRNKNSS